MTRAEMGRAAAADEARLAAVRAILTEPPERVRAIPSAVQRASALSMTGVMVLAAPPVGGAMLVLNGVRNSNLRLSSQLCALGGLYLALTANWGAVGL